MIGCEPDGINVNENCGSTHMEQLAEIVRSGGFDCGVAFDGDADRCLCVDERGESVDGDKIMAICALDLSKRGRLHKNTVVGTVMTNLGFIKFCEKNGLNFVATKVGDRFVLEEMLLGDYSFGGEQSGHIIFRDFATTGDGQLTAIQLLSLMRRTGQKLSELASVITVCPQVTVNIPVTPEGKLLFYTSKDIGEAIEKERSELGSDGRIVVRPSGTEPFIRVMAEGDDKELIHQAAQRVSNVIYDKIGEKQLAKGEKT
jgi:phosphoglucosamine mutase